MKDPSAYASPACLMHEIDPAYMGLPMDAERVKAWRRVERQRLLELRKQTSWQERTEKTGLLGKRLDHLLPRAAGRAVSLYWPMLAEPDLRSWMEAVQAVNGTCLLPVVARKQSPLVFRPWRPGEPLERDIFNIPIPACAVERRPDIIIAPVVGFDHECYRLGYGGGYFDRTLADLIPRPFVIGVGFEVQKIETIHPQPHDIPLDAVVTEERLYIRSEAYDRVSELFGA